MKKLKRALLYAGVVICLFLGLWIAQDNPQEVTITLLGFELGMVPVGLTLVISLATGVILGMLASLPVILRLGAINRRLEYAVKLPD